MGLRYTILFAETADADVRKWKRSGHVAAMKRISKLLEDIQEHPLTGLGKPEALKYNLSGKYSRRISDEHRIVYSIDEKNHTVTILSLWGHYLSK